MNQAKKNDTVVLAGSLILEQLSNKQYPDLASYLNIKTIDLQQLENVDSAGLAYIAQIKSSYEAVRFIGVSSKILVLAKLYGLSFLFQSSDI